MFRIDVNTFRHVTLKDRKNRLTLLSRQNVIMNTSLGRILSVKKTDFTVSKVIFACIHNLLNVGQRTFFQTEMQRWAFLIHRDASKVSRFETYYFLIPFCLSDRNRYHRDGVFWGPWHSHLSKIRNLCFIIISPSYFYLFRIDTTQSQYDWKLRAGYFERSF